MPSQPVSKDIATSLLFQQNSGISVQNAGALILSVSLKTVTNFTDNYPNTAILVVNNPTNASITHTCSGSFTGLFAGGSIDANKTGVFIIDSTASAGDSWKRVI